MESMIRHRYFVLSLLLIALCPTARGAEIGLTPKFRVFTDDSPSAAVWLRAFMVDDARYIRASWLDELEFSATDSSGQEVPFKVVGRRPGHNEDTQPVPSEKVGPSRVAQGSRYSKSYVSFTPLPRGEYTIHMKYQDLTASESLTVWDGQESREARIAKLEHDANQRGLSFEEYRDLKMKILAITPGDWVTLWSLGERAMGRAPMEEAAGYFTKSVESLRAAVERNIASEDPETKQRALDSLPGVERHERAARALIALMPEYYEDRERVVLRVNWEEKRVELVERPPKYEAATKVLRFIDIGKRRTGAIQDSRKPH